LSGENNERDMLLAQLRPNSGLPLFPREVLFFVGGRPVRRVAADFDEFFSFYRSNRDTDFYVGFFSIPQQRDNIYDAVLLDIDPGEGGDVEEKLRLVLKITEGFERAVYFTGRGYHVVLIMGPVVVPNWGMAVRRFLVDYGLDGLVDVPVAVDKRRVSRVVGTLNTKTGRRCVLVRYDIGDTQQLSALFEGYAAERDTEHPVGRLNIDFYPPCVLRAIETLRVTGELSHPARMFLANFLYRAGVRREDIHAVFRMASDYDPEKTDYEINHIVSGNYKLHSCETLKAIGLCPKRFVCRYYPSLNRFFVFSSTTVGGEDGSSGGDA